MIDRLKGDHKQLLDLFTQVNDAYDKGQFEQLHEKLNEFKMELTGHLLLENTKLYVYLRSKHSSEPQNKELISDMQMEMGKIGHNVFQFIRQSVSPGVTFDDGFKNQLDAVGQILIKRINAEEHLLYSMYELIEEQLSASHL